MKELERYTCVIGDYPDDEGGETETYRDPDGDFYMADDVDALLKNKAIVPRTIPQELLDKMRDERVLSPSRVLEMLIEWSESNA